MHQSNGYWIDSNNNKFSTSRFDEEHARIISDSNIDCHNCTDCYACRECDCCIDCEACTNCVYAQHQSNQYNLNRGGDYARQSRPENIAS